MDRNAALEEVRKRMREKKSGFTKDPNQFSPPKIGPGEETKYKFFVLPPLQAGETCATGKASKTMDLWYTTVGTHWVNKKPYECPRIHDGAECKFCQLGFDLLSDCNDDEVRKNIVKTYLARSSYAVNIYFPAIESVAEELRGKVMWYAMPKTVYDIMEATLMRDESKDVLDPQAFGFFYLPDESYVFQLEVSSQGGYNAYKTSKFLHSTRGPLIRNKDGTANNAEIQKVLAMRHDLFTKFAARDQAALARLAQDVLSGEPDRGSNSEVATKNPPVSKSPAKIVTAEESPVKAVITAQPKPAQTTKKTEVAVEAEDDELNNLLRDIRQS